MTIRGPGSVVGIATGYGLDGPGIESRWGARFSAPVQTSPGAHPASCTMGTGSFPGINSGRDVTLTLHPFWCCGKERVELYLYSPYRPYGLYRASVSVQGCILPYLSACTRVHFTLPQCLYKGALYLTSVPVQGCTVPYLSACTRVHFTLHQCLYKGALYSTLPL